MAFERIQVEPFAASLGAEVSGVDLAGPIDDPTVKEIHDAWMAHQVLVLRDQHIDVDQHKDFGRRFGELHIHPVIQPMAAEGHPEILVLEANEENPGVASSWHSDVTFQSAPPLGSILRCVTAPDVGGDTMWASMYAAYEALSPTMQEMLSGLRALHSGGLFKAVAIGEKKQALEADDEAVHPVVRTHPVTGRKALFVNPVFTRKIVGLRTAESRALLGFLFEHLASPDFTCRVRWREGTIVMWDNRCTQHRVVADGLSGRRRMERVTLLGDVPV